MILRLAAALAALAVSTASPARAGSTTVPVGPDRKVESAELAADAATGRAWVRVTVAKRFVSGREVRRAGAVMDVAVPGLSVERATGQVVLVSGDRRVTCGTLAGKVVPTGACMIDARIEASTVDTGLGLERRDRLAVAVEPR